MRHAPAAINHKQLTLRTKDIKRGSAVFGEPQAFERRASGSMRSELLVEIIAGIDHPQPRGAVALKGSYSHRFKLARHYYWSLSIPVLTIDLLGWKR